MIAPMLAQEPKSKDADLPGDGWMIEPKQDGWRFLFWQATAGAKGVRSYAGRNGSDRTGQPTRVERAFEFLPPDTILDSELIVPGEQSPAVSHALAHGYNVKAVVFDLLRFAGTDMTRMPYERRRHYLETLAEGFDPTIVELTQSSPSNPVLYTRWLDAGFEGAVAKKLGSTYWPGRRSWDWIKYKPQATADAVVVGFKAGKNGRAGTIGAFEVELLGTEVRTTVGVSVELSRDVLVDPDTWLGKVIEIKHNGIMESGKPRHGVWGRPRPDLDPVVA